MKLMLRIISAMAFCLWLFPHAAAQTPAETKMYEKTLKKPSVKAMNKFLKKFPESVYSHGMMRLRDSTLFAAVDKEDAAAVKAFAAAYPDSPLKPEIYVYMSRHNTSVISRAEAEAVAGCGAVGWRMDNVEYVACVGIMDDGSFSLSTYNVDGTKACEDRVIAKHELGSTVSTRLTDSLAAVDVNWRKMLTFSYINENSEGELEYVTVLYDYQNDNAYNAMFYGTGFMSSDGGYRIEGQCLETLSGGIVSAEQMWAMNRINDNPSLVTLPKSDLLSNEAIKWWMSKNSKVFTSSAPMRLNFGKLDPESSLVAGYEKAVKERGGKYNAALFDLRGYTVIVAYAKASGDYLLVWCEPVCRNRKTDRLLNNIYFEGNESSSLAMFYYHGRKTYKYRVNLSDKSLRK